MRILSHRQWYPKKMGIAWFVVVLTSFPRTTLANNWNQLSAHKKMDARMKQACDKAPERSASAGEQVKKVLPLYSYKDFKPSPTRVYVWHLDEAEDLVECLKG